VSGTPDISTSSRTSKTTFSVTRRLSTGRCKLFVFQSSKSQLSSKISKSPGDVLEQLLSAAPPQDCDDSKRAHTAARQVPNHCSCLTDCNFITTRGCCILTLAD